MLPAFLGFFLPIVVLAAEEPLPPYTDMNSVQALRNLEKITERSTKGMPELELSEFVRARFARIALLRLEGRSADAIAFAESMDRQRNGKRCELGAVD
jgi:hypothetical protein